MFKLFRKKLTKKGFTLAELLVVVAIIAILVAIAIPIFIGAIDKSEDAVLEADTRSVKAAAISEILTEWETYGYQKDNTSETAKSWTVSATVESSGEINGMHIKPSINATPDTAIDAASLKKDGTVVKDANGAYHIKNFYIGSVDKATKE